MNIKLPHLIVLSILVALTSSWLTATVVGQSVMQKARNRSVHVMQGFGSCSGVILQTNLVLTCAHCVEDKGEIKVSGKPAKLMKIDKQADLALLLVETISIDQISLADAEVGQDVFSLGYPYSSPNMVFTRGYVSVIQMDAVFATTTCMPGSSGSPLFDSSGNLVSITNGYMVVNSQISVSCLSSVLKEFLGRQK